ncbi:MAG: hypothetical protein Q4D22_01480 [Candidatus Saccharibacteria bacterium]|nr:hypothetical protein [Candidatus Saccharibacteria bacterium]
MLSTFCSLMVVVVVAWLAYHILDFIFEMLIVQKIYNASMTIAEEYLASHGRGFFKDENENALSMEWSVRLVLTFIYQFVFILLAEMLVPVDYKFWLITGRAIKIGVLLGFAINLLINTVIEFKHGAQIGRLLRIDDDGLGYFQGTYCDDFTADLSMWEPEERPPLDRRYMVLHILDNTGFSMLDLS